MIYLKKILFAIREEAVENAISNLLLNEYEVCGSVTYREGVVTNVHHLHPDIVMLAEALPGSTSIDAIIYEIRVKFRNVRIIMLAGKHEPGDDFLSSLISRGVYDIIIGGNTTLDRIVQIIRTPASYADVVALQDRDISSSVAEDTRQLNYVVTVPESQVPVKKGLFSKLRKNKDMEIRTLSQLDNETLERLKRTNASPDIRFVEQHNLGTNETAYSTTVLKAFDEYAQSDSYEQEIQCVADIVAQHASHIVPEATSRLTCYDIYREADRNGGVPIYELPPIMPKPIVTVFGGSRVGLGTTSIVINTAQALASSGKRVLVIDGCVNCDSSLFMYLGIEKTESGFDKAIEDYMNGLSVNPNYYCFARDRDCGLGDDEWYRRNVILNNIDYMCYSQNFTWGANDERLLFIGKYLDSLRSYYDHILIDTCFNSPDYFTKQYILAADNLVLIATQDNFVLSAFKTCSCSEFIHNFTGKKLSVTNFYSSGLSYYVNIMEALKVSANIDIPVDIVGFLSASYSKMPYYYDLSSKNKQVFVDLACLL